MKKIINGKRYDTEKANLVGEYSHLYPSDFNYVEEALYVTPISRQYFLAGKGGANTKYSQSVSQNSWIGGEKIIPLSRDDAFEWAHRHLMEDEVEAEFLDLIKDA